MPHVAAVQKVAADDAEVVEELNSERGKEKKQRLLAYLREHPEELRPAAI